MKVVVGIRTMNSMAGVCAGRLRVMVNSILKACGAEERGEYLFLP